MTQEYVVANVDDLLEGRHIIVEVQGREIGLFNVRGQYYALPNACFHQNGPLCRGATSGTVIASASTNWRRTWALDGEVVICPWHSLEYDVKTGQCLAYPGRKLPTWQIKVDGMQIKVLM